MPRMLRPGHASQRSIPTSILSSLRALRVERVGRLASSRSAAGRSGPARTTALSVHGRAASVRGAGAGVSRLAGGVASRALRSSSGVAL